MKFLNDQTLQFTWQTSSKKFQQVFILYELVIYIFDFIFILIQYKNYTSITDLDLVFWLIEDKSNQRVLNRNDNLQLYAQNTGCLRVKVC